MRPLWILSPSRSLSSGSLATPATPPHTSPPTTGQAKTKEAPQQEVLQVVRVTDAGTLLEQPERRLVLPLPVVEYPELDEDEPLKRFVPGLTADA